MNYVRFQIIGFVFLSVCIFCSSVLAQQDSSLFHCLTPDSVQPAAPAGERSLSPIAIYACGTSATNNDLPTWYRSIWTPTVPLSVPRFYKDNSSEKYIFKSDAFGLDSIDLLCFTFNDAGHPANQGLDRDYVAGWFQTVIPQADTLAGINFADFDNDGSNGIPASQDNSNGGRGDDDGYVDGVFFMIVNHTGFDGFSAVGRTDFDYTTRDTRPNGDFIKIRSGLVVAVKANDQERAVAQSAHEWGHALGLFDLYGRGGASPGAPLNEVGWWDLGAFSIMGIGWPLHRAVPFDPYSRIALGWDTATVVNSPLFGRQILDYLTTGTIYKLPKSSSEYFLVTNHKGVDPEADLRGIWEQRMPGNLGGLMIWHIDETAPYGGYRNNVPNDKRIDCELAQGLFNYTSDYSQTTGVNPVSGRDSLDFLIKKLVSPPNPCCTTWVGFTPPNIASRRCYWNQETQINFDGLTNPNSNEYSSSIDPSTGMRSQNIPTHLAVRNIQKNPQSFATADLLVNNWYGHITQNTTWGPGVYAITGDITVDAGKTLTIQPGTTVYFQQNEDNQRLGLDTTKCELIVASGGKLVAVGTATSPIKFLSSATSPGTEDWRGIRVEGTGSATLRFCHIRNAYEGINYETVLSADTIKNVHVAQCKMYGIRVASPTAIRIENCGVDSVNGVSGGYGIWVNGAGSTSLLKRDTVRNCFYGMYLITSVNPIDSCRVEVSCPT